MWITNVELPDIAEHFGRIVVVGGWMAQMSHQLSAIEDIELFVACKNYKKVYSDEIVNKIHYYSFSAQNSKEELNGIFEKIKPDLIHIWGTEEKHAFDSLYVAEDIGLLNHTIVSIQGLVSVYARHYIECLPAEIVNKRTFKEYLGRPNIADSQKLMERQGKIEIAALNKAKHCIGRTDWDYACVKQINPDIEYHFCNETLRGKFYKAKWNYENCKKHRIFFSQAHYPVKGFHNLIGALPIILQVYPNTEVHVVGYSPLEFNGFVERLKLSSYQKYLTKMILKYGLENCIEWKGKLSESEMIDEYCEANVFVCSSSIENSSNSIGEAMLLGVPVVASDVGGIKSIMIHEKEGLLYQSTAPYMLADCIIRIFKDKKLAEKLSDGARRRAQVNYNPQSNLKQLLDIYQELLR